MYWAVLEGDWLAAEVILSRDPNLAHDYVTEEGWSGSSRSHNDEAQGICREIS